MRKAIGIDIGGTNTKIGIASEDGKLLNFQKFPTKEPRDFKSFTAKVNEVCDELLALSKLGPADIAGIGVGAPNGNYKTGKIVSPPNLKHWGTVDLISHFKQVFEAPVYLDNDANVAAAGEGRWGSAKGMRDYIVVTLGTGIGTGVVANGEMVRGGNGLAGEGGHIIVEPNGRLCGCGGNGHLEMYGSVSGIKMTVKEMLGKDMTFAQIYEAYENRDADILKVFEVTAETLGRGLSSMASLMAPETFVLAGGVATIGEKFCQQVKASMNNYVYPPFRGQIDVRISSISTGEGAVLGAAGMALT